MKIHKKTLPLMAAGMLLAAVTVSCDRHKAESTSTSGIATIACDATFENILSQEIDVFEYIYPEASIMPYYVDEHAAIDSLMNFSTKMAITTRPLTEKEVEYFKSNKKNVRQSQIAVDAIALIVNPANPTEMLSKKEIAQILTGELSDWDKVTPGIDGQIKVVFDHQGSSTVHYMRDSLLNGADFGENVFAQKTPQAVFDAVAADKKSIGVIGVSWITGDLKGREMTREELAAAVERNDSTEITFSDKIKVLKVHRDDEVTAFKPYQYYIYTGEYPLYRQIYMITTAAGATISSGFYSFVTGFQGQKIMLMTGILPKVIRPQMVNIN
ncbi:MAG: substrate-binding domain-containing protein [Muribaculaceae bacterium]|nr:substrate-binding domain-containing protein [Muribaculaceae bacterium]